MLLDAQPLPRSTFIQGRFAPVTGAIVSGMIALAFVHAMAGGRPLLADERSLWLAIHLASVIPALPLGAYVLVSRKGDARHRLLGRIWAGLMMAGALSSFGLTGLTGSLSWIHILSVVVLVMIPRGIFQAMRHNIARHRRTMTLTYLGLVGAGLFTFLPGRLLHAWLLG